MKFCAFPKKKHNQRNKTDCRNVVTQKTAAVQWSISPIAADTFILFSLNLFNTEGNFCCVYKICSNIIIKAVASIKFENKFGQFLLKVSVAGVLLCVFVFFFSIYIIIPTSVLYGHVFVWLCMFGIPPAPYTHHKSKKKRKKIGVNRITF